MSVNINQPKAFTWLFGSKSNPKAVPHETIQYVDGSVSCNCPGWTRRVADDGSRECRHTRLVDTGVADDYSVKKIDHMQGKVKPKPIKIPKAKEEEPIAAVEPQKKALIVARKIQW